MVEGDAGGAAGSAAGESVDSTPARQSGGREGRGQARALARRGSLLGLEQAASKEDGGQGLGSWKVPRDIAKLHHL